MKDAIISWVMGRAFKYYYFLEENIIFLIKKEDKKREKRIKIENGLVY